ncbi:hypothetical protein H8356DRAFT_1325677 [Neocallimastix lanati (nom. inval.)]|nr:hypothetical protein H8356DRAFT_1325677 [Neocallimastix sp. JGI-2020a]
MSASLPPRRKLYNPCHESVLGSILFISVITVFTLPKPIIPIEDYYIFYSNKSSLIILTALETQSIEFIIHIWQEPSSLVSSKFAKQGYLPTYLPTYSTKGLMPFNNVDLRKKTTSLFYYCKNDICVQVNRNYENGNIKRYISKNLYL